MQRRAAAARVRDAALQILSVLAELRHESESIDIDELNEKMQTFS